MIKTRCIITGYRGYIGSHLYSELKKRDNYELLGIDIKDTEEHDIKNLLKKDSKIESIIRNFKPDYIFHLAATPRVGTSIDKPVDTMYNNVMCGSLMLNIAKEVGCKRFIYSSSSSVKGDGKGPVSPYALQKYTTELEAKIYSSIYDLDTVSLRYFNVYSEDQKADGSYPTAVSNWMRSIKDGIDPFITGTGNQRRDMIHVKDAVSANIFVMEHEERFNGKYFEIGTGDNISLNEMKEILLQYVSETNFNYTDERLGDVKETKADNNDMLKLGWKMKYNIQDGLHQCFKQLKEELNK